MRLRTVLVAAGVVAAAVFASAVNVALLDRASSSGPERDDGLAAALTAGASTPVLPPTTVVSTTVPGDVTSAEGRRYQVGEAGVVTLRLRDGAITVLAVESATGWRWAYQQRDPDEVRIGFTSPSGVAMRFRAEIESDGELRVDIGDDADD